MTYVLRLVRQSRWDRRGHLEPSPTSDIPADPLADFAGTTENRLSVWSIDDRETQLRQLITALAASRDKLDKLDYVLFLPRHLETIGIQVTESLGDTCDDLANSWHRELIGLTAGNVVELTRLVFREHLEIQRVDEHEVKELIADAVKIARIQRDRLKPKLRAAIDAS